MGGPGRPRCYPGCCRGRALGRRAAAAAPGRVDERCWVRAGGVGPWHGSADPGRPGDRRALPKPVWYPAVKAAAVRRFAPRIMRRTAASWLVQDGVPLYDVQALLGHEDYATTPA